ncbi:amino acid transporter [Lentinula edodes]|uniref:Amino acid transporter n=1 Tax=Lentinula edodes TaxID=5353 RepID=A0A1Q3EET5_LENED|nr:amino acid transporter [Lentinula edodes]
MNDQGREERKFLKEHLGTFNIPPNRLQLHLEDLSQHRSSAPLRKTHETLQDPGYLVVRPMSSTIRPTTKFEELKGTRPASEDGFDVALSSTVQDDAKLQPDNTQHLTRRRGFYHMLFMAVLGYWVVTVSVTFGTSQLVLAGANIYLPQWEATAWQTYLIFALVVLLTTAVAIVFDHSLPFLDSIAAAWNLLGIIIIVVSLSVKASAGRHSAKYALTHFDASQSGWTPGWAFFIGMLPGAYTFLGVPTIVTMGEEIFNPSINLPKAIVWAVPTGCLLGVVFLLPILFTLPDIAVLLAAPEGQPEALVFELIMGSKAGGFGMWFIIFGLTVLCGLSVTCATSRATWAFARDKAIPFHHIFARLGRGRLSDTPVNAYLLSAVIQLALGCAIPILLLLARRREPARDVPFSLGVWGYPLNVLAVLWIAFEMVIVSMPVSLPVQPSDMNYASAVFVGFIVISALWYIIDGRHIYKGPFIPN